jgi:integrase
MRAVRQRTDADKVAVLKNATKAYIKDRQQSKAPEAAMQARVVLDEFVPLCKGITYTKAVTREHVLAFHNALRERGCSDRTVANKHRRLKSFFLFCKIDTAFLGSVPKYENKLPTIYSPSEVKAIREASDPYMRLVVDMALKLGLREQELCFSTWEDIDRDNAVFRVQGKPRLGFAVKDSEQRDVPIPADLLTGLTEWYQTHKGRDLILGTASDKPNTHLLRTLKRLAKRAGLNCGKCDGCQGKLGECQEWTLHKFRRTYLTTLLRNGLDLKTVQHYAGHSDLASTMRYLRPASTSETQDRINAIKWE